MKVTLKQGLNTEEDDQDQIIFEVDEEFDCPQSIARLKNLKMKRH